MKKTIWTISIAVTVAVMQFSACTSERAGTYEVINMKCEHMVNPLGIDTGIPRLTWQMADEGQGARKAKS